MHCVLNEAVGSVRQLIMQKYYDIFQDNPITQQYCNNVVNKEQVQNSSGTV